MTLDILRLTETEKGIFDAILHGEIDFASEPWPSISSCAKDLICKMLTQDPKKRITPSEVLGKKTFVIASQSTNQFLLIFNFWYTSKQMNLETHTATY